MTEQIGIRCALMRGGTSKGAYFLASDLPDDPAARDRILLAALGSPDPRQIDGIGGAHPLTSKVAVVSKSDRPDCDVDYLFLQIGNTGSVQNLPFGGTAVLIMIGVGLDTVKQIESQLMQRNYEGFLK